MPPLSGVSHRLWGIGRSTLRIPGLRPFLICISLGALLVLALARASQSAEREGCGLLEKYPHTSAFTLSTGARIALPTQAAAVDSYALLGWLDPDATDRYLAPFGLHGLHLQDGVLAALSVYDYRRSDFGPFREAYFALVATGRGGKIALFHLAAWSDSPVGALASAELWGIPSRLARVEATDSTDFQVTANVGPVFTMHWATAPFHDNPVGHSLRIAAVGETGRWSPVEACGPRAYRNYDAARDRLTVRDPRLLGLMKDLDFRPAYLETARGQEAVQFPPDPAD